ncbi:YiiX/YebB-like N1pC/P60 family cysteine hydrolase [Enterobacteriaceae bacterium LUAb1]
MIKKLHTLDIIFIYHVTSALDELIAECGLNYGNTLINHVGLYIGNNEVIEAGRQGVVLTRLQDFLQGHVYVKRLQVTLNKSEVTAVINKAKSHIHKSYNHSFESDKESIYCSELIVSAFESIGNKSPFKRHPITFNNYKTHQTDPKWPEYYNHREDIPEGQPGSHPNSLFESI